MPETRAVFVLVAVTFSLCPFVPLCLCPSVVSQPPYFCRERLPSPSPPLAEERVGVRRSALTGGGAVPNMYPLIWI
jgi:hypothetical protein